MSLPKGLERLIADFEEHGPDVIELEEEDGEPPVPAPREQ
jgi:hypothetical protein